jgi:hypothetical protein
MEQKLRLQWINTGIISGLLTFIVYPLMILVELPVQFTLMLAFLFGILFMLASIGLYNFISIDSKTTILQSALLFNIIACSIVIMMFTIQLALFSERKYTGSDASKELSKYIFQLVNLVQLSLDIVWDMFISIGTILFAMSMFKHPKLGKIIGSAGVLLGTALLFNNIYYFPVPPAESGSIDFGPFVALWYLGVTVMMLMSLKWAKEMVYPA